jgi:Fic family protein
MRIIKRKKGKQYYFYLQHSFRKKGKVITREKYLGQEIPKDINKIKIAFREQSKLDLIKMLNLIKKNFQADWIRLPESVKEKELEEIAIAFTYNTNAIEGSTITLAEAREIIHDKIAPNKPLRDVREAETHSKIFLEMLKKKEKITESLLLKWHKDIFEETKEDIAGKFRTYLVRVGSYLSPDWQDIKKLMQGLIEFIYKSKKMNPVELSARVHYKFEKIHPFGDGNGRIGRLLMNYILWHNDYPMLIIEYKKRKSYYKALQKDEDGFVAYFLRRYIAIHRKNVFLSL